MDQYNPTNNPNAKLVKIKFLETVNWEGGGHPHLAKTFEVGKTYEVTTDVAEKWVTRKKAEYTDKPNVLKPVVPVSPEEQVRRDAEEKDRAAKDNADTDDEDDEDKPKKGIVGPAANKSHAAPGHATPHKK